MEEEGLLTAAATRRNEEEPLLPLQLAPAALEARQAAVALQQQRLGFSQRQTEVKVGTSGLRLVSAVAAPAQ